MVQLKNIFIAAFLIASTLAAPNPISQHQVLVSRTVDILERGIENDMIQERSFGSFFKKIGHGIKKVFNKAKGIVSGVGKVVNSPVGSAVMSAVVKRQDDDLFERDFYEELYIRDIEDAIFDRDHEDGVEARELENLYERDWMTEELEEREFDDLD